MGYDTRNYVSVKPNTVLPPQEDIVVCFLTHAERSECYSANFQKTFKPPDKATGSSLTLTYRFIISCIKCPERRAKGTSHSLLQKVILIISLQHS